MVQGWQLTDFKNYGFKFLISNIRNQKKSSLLAMTVYNFMIIFWRKKEDSMIHRGTRLGTRTNEFWSLILHSITWFCTSLGFPCSQFPLVMGVHIHSANCLNVMVLYSAFSILSINVTYSQESCTTY